MAKWAIVNTQSGIVENVALYEEPPTKPPPGYNSEFIAVQSDCCGPGWRYENSTFTAPMQAPAPEESIIQKIAGLEAIQHRAVREVLLGTSSLDHLKSIDDQIAALRKQL